MAGSSDPADSTAPTQESRQAVRAGVQHRVRTAIVSYTVLSVRAHYFSVAYSPHLCSLLCVPCRFQGREEVLLAVSLLCMCVGLTLRFHLPVSSARDESCCLAASNLPAAREGAVSLRFDHVEQWW